MPFMGANRIVPSEPGGEVARPPGTRIAVVPLSMAPEALAPVTQVRSTLMTSSLKTLHERDLLETYFKRLAPAYHDTVRSSVAGVWLPVEVTLAHYRACDALGLAMTEQLEIGRQVGVKIQGTLLGTMANLTKQAGVTPWAFLSKLDRLYDRLVIGGGLAVEKIAMKEAVVHVYKVPLFDVPYFATAWRGVIQGLCELFCTKAYVKRGSLSPAMKMTYTISWA
jgi:hypothetical protein